MNIKRVGAPLLTLKCSRKTSVLQDPCKIAWTMTTRSNQLPREGKFERIRKTESRCKCGLPGRNRTRDPLLRRQMLYPTELRAGNGSEGLPKMGIPPARRGPSTLGGKRNVVGVKRFELPTSCSQSRRATRLRYTPRGWDYR